MSHGVKNDSEKRLNAGCYNCGGGKDEMLMAKTVNATSVALCSKCQDMQTVPRMPFDYRNAN